MNLIGPRPERPEFVQELARDLPGYMHRTEVRPGITGLAQLRLGYDEQISEVSKKVNLDLRYIRTASLRLDLSLLVWTIPYITYQVLSRMVVSLRNWSRRDEPERAIVPLVSPTSRIDGPEESLVPEPHFPPADQCKESKSGEPRRCSA